MIARYLVAWSEGMNVAKLWPSERNHAAGAVQLHRATPKRYHTMYETDIFGRKMMNVTKHFRFRMVLIEHWMNQVFGCAS
jgi:hypothetical protein